MSFDLKKQKSPPGLLRHPGGFDAAIKVTALDGSGPRSFRYVIAGGAPCHASDIGAYEADPNLRITRIAKAGGDIRLQFSSMLGRNYRIDSEDAITGPWSTLSNNIPGTGGAFQAVDTGAANLPQRFYRAVMLLP